MMIIWSCLHTGYNTEGWLLEGFLTSKNETRNLEYKKKTLYLSFPKPISSPRLMKHSHKLYTIEFRNFLSILNPVQSQWQIFKKIHRPFSQWLEIDIEHLMFTLVQDRDLLLLKLKALYKESIHSIIYRADTTCLLTLVRVLALLLSRSYISACDLRVTDSAPYDRLNREIRVLTQSLFRELYTTNSAISKSNQEQNGFHGSSSIRSGKGTAVRS